jgi:magnesium transporter
MYEQGVTGSREIAEREIAPNCARDDTLLWIIADGADADAIDRVADDLSINAFVREDLHQANQRTKLECYGDHCHVSLRDCSLDGTSLVSREIDVVFGQGWVLSVAERRATGPEPTLDDVRQEFERHRGEAGADDEGFLVWALLDLIVDRYFAITDAIDDRLDDIEMVVFDERVGEGVPREVFELRRSLVAFRRAAAPLREVLAELVRGDVRGIGPQAVVHLQDVYDHVLRVSDLIESQRDVLTSLLEAHLAIVSNRMNQVMKLTSSWGAILIVATLVAGIYGMNFIHMPELRWRYGYVYALALMAVLTLLLYRMFKRRDWL